MGTLRRLAYLILTWASITRWLRRPRPAWRELKPAGTKPVARWQHRAIYDAVMNQMLVFGGKTNESGPDLNFNDVWILEDADETGGMPGWIQLTPGGAPPVARHMHTIVYDPATRRIVLFGGHVDAGGPFSNDVWVLKNAIGPGAPGWMQLNPGGTAPSPREWHSAVYDGTSNRMLIFGGTASGDNEVWALLHANGLGGPASWQTIGAGGQAPSPRLGHSAVYDAANRRMVVFGGQIMPSGAFTSEVWVLSLADGSGGMSAWHQLSPSGAAPAPRSDHTAVYDAPRNRMIVFGGWSYSGATQTYYNDVWVLLRANGLDGVPAWNLLAPNGPPPEKRELHSAVYNQTSGRMIVFGGSVTPTSMRNDVWLLLNAAGP